MKLKRTALISLGALIGFTLFYIGLNQWQSEKESSGKINIVNPPTQTTQLPTEPQTPQTTQQTNQQTNPQTQPPQQTQASTPSTQTPTPNTAQTPNQSTPTLQASKKTNTQKPQKTITQIIRQSVKRTPTQTNLQAKQTKPQPQEGVNVFQIGAFKSQTSLQRAIAKARALGFEPMVKEEKGFYIVRIQIQGSKDGIKLLTAFPGAFKVR